MEKDINYQYEEIPKEVVKVLNEIYAKGGEHNENKKRNCN